MAANTLAIKITARDEASGALRKVMGSVDKTTGKARRGFKNATDKIFSFKSAIVGLAGSAGVGMLAKSIIDTASNIETMTASLDTLTKGKGTETFERLSKWAADMPVDTQKAVGAYKNLVAMGLKPTIKQMTTLVDTTSAVGGGADTLEGVARALGQIQTKGKVSAEELMQLAERGIPAYQILQDELGLTQEEVSNIGNSGIEAEKAIQALFEGMKDRFGGASAKYMNTWAGMVEQLKDRWWRFKKDIADAGMFAYLKAGLKAIVDQIEVMKKEGDLKFWAKEISDAIVAGMKVSITAAEQLGKAFYGLKGIFYALRIAFDKFMSLIFEGVEKVTGGVASLLDAVGLDSWAEKLENVSTQYKGLSDAAADVAKDSEKEFMNTAEAIEKIDETAEDVWSNIEKNAKDSMEEQKEKSEDTNKDIRREIEETEKQHKRSTENKKRATSEYERWLKGYLSRVEKYTDKSFDDRLDRFKDHQQAVRTVTAQDSKKIEKIWEELAEDRYKLEKWVENEITKNLASETEKRKIEIERAHKERVNQLDEFLKEGRITEKQYADYVRDSEQILANDLKNLQTEVSNQRMITHKEELRKRTWESDNFFEFLKNKYAEDTADFRSEKVKQYKDWLTYYEALEDIVNEFADSSRNTLSNILFDAYKGDMKSFEEYWENFWDRIAQVVTEKIADIAVSKGADLVASWIGSYDTGAYEVDKDQVAFIHKGEMILPKDEAETFRDSLEKATGMESIADQNPAAAEAFKDTAVDYALTQYGQRAAVGLVGTVRGGIVVNPMTGQRGWGKFGNVAGFMTDPSFGGMVATGATVEGLEAMAEEALGIKGSAITEKIGTTAEIAAAMLGVTNPANLMGFLATKAIGSVVDMALGYVSQHIHDTYSDIVASNNVFMDKIGDMLDARDNEVGLDALEASKAGSAVANAKAGLQAKADIAKGFVDAYMSKNPYAAEIALNPQVHKDALTGFIDANISNPEALGEALGQGMTGYGGYMGLGIGNPGSYGGSNAPGGTGMHDQGGYGGLGIGNPGSYGGGGGDTGMGANDEAGVGAGAGPALAKGGYIDSVWIPDADEGLRSVQTGEYVVSRKGVEFLDKLNSGDLSGMTDPELKALLRQAIVYLRNISVHHDRYEYDGILTRTEA